VASIVSMHRLLRAQDNQFSAVDVARRVLQWMGQHIVLADGRTDSELSRKGPYGFHPWYPKLVELLRCESGNEFDHAVIFVGLMRYAQIPARVVRLDGNRYIAEFFLAMAGWIPVNPKDKSEDMVNTFGVWREDSYITGYGEGVVVDAKKPESSGSVQIDLQRKNISPVWLHNLSPSWEAILDPGSDGLPSDVKDWTIPPLHQVVLQNSNTWFDSRLLGDQHVLSYPPPIFVPALPEGIIEKENKRLLEEFGKLETARAFDTILSAFLNQIKNSDWKVPDAKSPWQLGPGLLNLVQTHRGLDKALGHLYAVVSGLGRGWPAEKNEVEFSTKWEVHRVEKRGNQGLIFAVPATLNHSEVTISCEFIHSRGAAINEISFALRKKVTRS